MSKDIRAEELINEIKQISEQYNSEVSRSRKTWPESVKRRILELRTLGLRWNKISSLTGISYYTILNWSDPSDKKAPEFKVVTVTEPVAQVEKSLIKTNLATVTVTILDRIKIEGLTIQDTLTILEKYKI